MADNSKTLTLTLQVKDDGSVVVDTVKGKIDELQKSTTSGGKSITDVLGGVKAGWLAVAAGAAAAYGTVKEFLDAASEAEQIESRMAFQLGQVGYNFQEIKPFVDSFADSILKTTRFSDEMARQGLGQMMQYTADVEQAMQGVKLAMDMSTQSGQDLGSTTRLVGMAMNGNAEILGRWIPELRDLDSKLGSNATNAEKAAYAIKVLNEKFGGASQTDLNTYAGQIQNLKNQFDELKESAGRALMPLAKLALAGAKGISTGIEALIGPNLAEQTKNFDAQIAAAKKANEQAKIAAAAKAYADDLALWKGNQEARQAMNYQFAIQEWTLKKNTMAVIDAQEFMALEKAKTIGADLNQIRTVYHKIRIDQIKKEKEEEQTAMLSLASMWKVYYDDRISKENEIIGLVKGQGIETTIGAKFEFANVEEQFRKITEKAGMFTPEEFERLKAAYTEKLKAILPFAGGEWEEISVPTGKTGARSGFGYQTEYGADYRWKEGMMTEEERRIEQMREESMRRVERMSAGVTGATHESIVGSFDQQRQAALELQQQIDAIKDVQFAVQATGLAQTINDLRALSTEVSNLNNKVLNIQVDINGQEIAQNIEQQLTDRWNNKRSIYRSAIERTTGGSE